MSVLKTTKLNCLASYPPFRHYNFLFFSDAYIDEFLYIVLHYTKPVTYQKICIALCSYDIHEHKTKTHNAICNGIIFHCIHKFISVRLVYSHPQMLRTKCIKYIFIVCLQGTNFFFFTPQIEITFQRCKVLLDDINIE